MDILYREIAKDGRLDNNCLQTLISTMDYEEETDISMSDSSPLKETKSTGQARRARKRLFKNKNLPKNAINLDLLPFCYDGTEGDVLDQGDKDGRVSKHVPHALQPPEKVEQRNTRERNRVHTVNSEFRRLRHLLPVYNRGKRISKENILKYAIRYIEGLQSMIREHDQSNEYMNNTDQPKPLKKDIDSRFDSNREFNLDDLRMESMETDEKVFTENRNFEEELADDINQIDQYCSENNYLHNEVIFTNNGDKYCEQYTDNNYNKMEIDTCNNLEDPECLLDLEELCHLSW